MMEYQMKVEFLKERYDFELNRREQLTAALALPVGVLGGLGSVLALMARSFVYRHDLLTKLFVPFLVVDVVAFFACLTYLARAYHRQKYLYLPLLQELQDWENLFVGLHSYEVAMGQADEAFEKHIGERIIEAADRNTQNNDERSRLLYWSRVSLFVVLGLTALAGIPFVVNQVRFAMPTQQTPQPQPAAPQNTSPQPPQFPPNREIREGDRPRPR
jgi:hypothetical protein